MFSPTVQINEDTFLELAKTTIVPLGIKCECCGSLLSCWHALGCHQVKHHKTIKAKGKGSRIEKEDLHTHIKNAHLNRVTLICPIKTCNYSAARTNQLVSHFHDFHLRLDGQTIARNSDLLSPSWVPIRVAEMPEPPPLPRNIPIGTLLVPVASGQRKRAPAPASQPSGSRLKKTTSVHQLPPPRKRASPPSESANEQKKLVFEDLEPFIPEDNDGELPLFKDYILQRPAELQKDVARPQAIMDPTTIRSHSPPVSIHFDVFQRSVQLIVENEAKKP
ncbi:hypothetical protein BDZ89DRAFT_1152948 [Hymenopellis radicata]|nr:hypothetical protein BDZ89DRAFT_1152948 [Hymenopellis radicata]